MSNPIYDDLSFYTSGYSGGGSSGPVNVTTGPNRAVLQMVDDNGEFLRHVVTSSAGVVSVNDTEIDGTTAYVTSGTVRHATADALPKDAGDLVETKGRVLTLTPGSYTRADLLSSLGATAVLSLAVTCRSGTIDFLSGGSVENLEQGESVTIPYAAGMSVSDFTITVDAGSEAVAEIRGL